MFGSAMAKVAIQVIPLDFIRPWNIAESCEVMGLLRSCETYLRVSRQVNTERRRTAAGRTHQEEIGKSAGFGMVQRFTFGNFGYDSKPLSRTADNRHPLVFFINFKLHVTRIALIFGVTVSSDVISCGCQLHMLLDNSTCHYETGLARAVGSIPVGQ